MTVILGPLLAEHEPADGWWVSIHDGAPQHDGRYVVGQLCRLAAVARSYLNCNAWTGRQGTTVITSPSGDRVVSGYWMDWPETEWGLFWLRYRAMERNQRAALEVYQQATAYSPIPFQFQLAWAYPERRLPKLTL